MSRVVAGGLWKGLCILVLCLPCFACESSSEHPRRPPQDPQKLFRLVALLSPEYSAMNAPQPGDWLSVHPEPGQTFSQYLSCRPTLPLGTRRTIYVQPIGDFGRGSERVLDLACSYLAAFYDLPVRKMASVQVAQPPAWAIRATPSYALIGPPETAASEFQYHTGYLLNSLLKTRLPVDAAVMIGFTNADLWPGEQWNFVFGVGSTTERVGVWSLSRFGSPEGEERITCLKRALKLAVHETGHMFSLQHCVKYACVMNGCNHLGETDRAPLDVCPECLAKICYLAGYDPVERFARMAEFCRSVGFKDEAQLLLARRDLLLREW